METDIFEFLEKHGIGWLSWCLQQRKEKTNLMPQIWSDGREVEIKVRLVAGGKPSAGSWDFCKKESRANQEHPGLKPSQRTMCSLQNLSKGDVQWLVNTSSKGFTFSRAKGQEEETEHGFHIFIDSGLFIHLPQRHFCHRQFWFQIWILSPVLCKLTSFCSIHCDFPKQFVTFHPRQ